jgi:ABC-2 type transport system permease protein
VLNFFYSLIAMACFYGGFLGLRVINDTQADISSLAARINVAPVHKIKTFIYSMSAALLIHIVETFTLLAFLRYVLNIDFGSKTGYVLLTTILGSVAGVFMGALISAMVKKSEAMKVAILLAVTMGGSFLAGMMVGEMKYIVAQNLPALSYINPINLLTDALYSLYYYDSLSRYFTNMAILAAYILIFGLGTHLIVRRRKYARL